MLNELLKGIEYGAIIVIYPKGVKAPTAVAGPPQKIATVEPSSVPEPGAGAAPVGNPCPEDEPTRRALTQAIYNSFGEYRRRSVRALAQTTGLSQEAVLELLDGNTDFRISIGRDSGEQFVSVRGIDN